MLIAHVTQSGYGLVAMTFASHAKGREFDPHYPYISICDILISLRPGGSPKAFHKISRSASCWELNFSDYVPASPTTYTHNHVIDPLNFVFAFHIPLLPSSVRPQQQ